MVKLLSFNYYVLNYYSAYFLATSIDKTQMHSKLSAMLSGEGIILSTIINKFYDSSLFNKPITDTYSTW